jgi:hypothetical protein
MRRPSQPALTDAGTGRVSMPFLPTLAVVAILGTASLYCPTSNPVLPVSHAAAVQPVSAPAPALTDFARAAAVAPEPGRLPASMAFAEAFPLDKPASAPGTTPARAASPARGLPHLAVANRRSCPGRRCPDMPLRGSDPLAAAHAEAAEPTEERSMPSAALPFTDTVAETLAPAARVLGDAATIVRGSATALQGSVAMAVAECLR